MPKSHDALKAPVNLFDAVILAEEGDISSPEVLDAWQSLVDTGVVWQLQGWFGRQAAALIEAGEIRQ